MGRGTQRTGRESSYPSGGYPLGCRANVAVLQSPDLGHEKYDSETNEAEKAGRESAHRGLPRLADHPSGARSTGPLICESSAGDCRGRSSTRQTSTPLAPTRQVSRRDALAVSAAMQPRPEQPLKGRDQQEHHQRHQYRGKRERPQSQGPINDVRTREPKHDGQRGINRQPNQDRELPARGRLQGRGLRLGRCHSIRTGSICCVPTPQVSRKPALTLVGWARPQLPGRLRKGGGGLGSSEPDGSR